MKVFKHNNKLAVYLSGDVSKALGIEENDEVDFFKYNDKAFLFLKKDEVSSLVSGNIHVASPVVQKGNDYISNAELQVLKKLDTVRYQQRTKKKVAEILDKEESRLLEQLIEKKAVNTFKKDNQELYSISRQIYDKFLMRKKMPEQSTASRKEAAPLMPKVQLSGHIEGPYSHLIKILENDGFLVVQTEAEAGGVSLALEDSIRHGKVLGTRSFNKKFYIVTRQFFDMHNGKIIAAMREGMEKTQDIAKKANLSEEGARAILQLLAESGDAREKKRDSFTLA
jgi:hypothetical protein